MISPDGSLLGAANLGADELEIFRVDYDKERLCLASSKPVDWGKEPRHMAFHPTGEYLYLLTESGNRIYDYKISKSGALSELAIYSTLDPEKPAGGMAADIVVSPDGRFVYSSNRGQHNVAVWKILDSGLLDSIAFVSCGGEGPRGLNISPDGSELLCANNDDDTVTVLPIDKGTGIPGAPIATAKVNCAACVRTK
jgi:6-phosphogluconolactonase